MSARRERRQAVRISSFSKITAKPHLAHRNTCAQNHNRLFHKHQRYRNLAGNHTTCVALTLVVSQCTFSNSVASQHLHTHLSIRVDAEVMYLLFAQQHCRHKSVIQTYCCEYLIFFL